MIWLPRILQRLRRSRRVGAGFVFSLLLVAIVGNSLTFYFFDKADKPDLTMWDAIWYSLISITTIGYGDLSASSVGARIGTLFFIVLLGLSAFSALIGFIVDLMMNLNFRELHGLSTAYCKDHVIIIHFPDTVRVEKIIRELREDPQYADVDIVLVNDRLDTLPFDIPGVLFVKGSPLQIETLERAGLNKAQTAIILCTAQDDAGSDGKVASVLTIVEHLHPKIKTIAECLDERHEILFRSTNCDSVVYSNQLINNLLVQETQDIGVSSLVTTLTDNGQGYTLYSTQVDSHFETSYDEICQRFKDSARVLSIHREDEQVLEWERLKAQKNDRLIYIAKRRHTWPELMAMKSS